MQQGMYCGSEAVSSVSIRLSEDLPRHRSAEMYRCYAGSRPTIFMGAKLGSTHRRHSCCSAAAVLMEKPGNLLPPAVAKLDSSWRQIRWNMLTAALGYQAITHRRRIVSDAQRR